MAIENGYFGGQIWRGTWRLLFYCWILVVVTGMGSLCENPLSYTIRICVLHCLQAIFF